VKLKTIITATLAVVLIISLMGWSRSCAGTKKAKADYLAFREVVESEKLAMSNRLDFLTKAIGQRDETIGQLEHKVAQYVEKTSTLTAELTALQNAEPPTTPEVEALPIVVNLRAQVSKVTEMLTLSQKTVTLQRQEIDAYVDKVSLLEQVIVEWKGAWDREHTLRVQAEDLFKLYERKQKLNRFWKTTAVVATGAVAGILLIK
jgi:chromosome segregation ATPase